MSRSDCLGFQYIVIPLTQVTAAPLYSVSTLLQYVPEEMSNHCQKTNLLLFFYPTNAKDGIIT